MPVTLDGSATGTATNISSFTVAGTLTTTGNPSSDAIIVVITSSSNTPWPQATQLSDTAGLSWIRRQSITFQTSAGQYQTTEEWYATTTPNLSADSLTVTFNQTVDSTAVIWFGLTPSLANVAFDSASAFPVFATGNSSIPTITYSTSQGSEMVVGLYGGITDETSAGAGWTLIGHATVTGASYTTSVAAQYFVPGSLQSGASSPFGVSSTGWIDIGDGYYSNATVTGSKPNPATGAAGLSLRAGDDSFNNFGWTTL